MDSDKLNDNLYCVVRYNPEIQFSFARDVNKESAICGAMDKYYDQFTFEEEGFSRYYYGTYDTLKVPTEQMQFSYVPENQRIPETSSVFDNVKKYNVHIELPKSIDIEVYGYTEELVKRVIEIVLCKSKVYDNGTIKSELRIVPEKITVEEKSS